MLTSWHWFSKSWPLLSSSDEEDFSEPWASPLTLTPLPWAKTLFARWLQSEVATPRSWQWFTKSRRLLEEEEVGEVLVWVVVDVSVTVEVRVVVRSVVDGAVAVAPMVDVDVLPEDELELESCLEFFGVAATAARSTARVIKVLDCIFALRNEC